MHYQKGQNTKTSLVLNIIRKKINFFFYILTLIINSILNKFNEIENKK